MHLRRNTFPRDTNRPFYRGDNWEIGWKLLSILPRSELKRIDDKLSGSVLWQIEMGVNWLGIYTGNTNPYGADEAEEKAGNCGQEAISS